MKFLIGQISHETNTFSNIKTEVGNFKQWDWSYGQDIINKYQNVREFIGGMIDQCKEEGIEIIPTFSALTRPSGIITSGTYSILKEELIKEIKKSSNYDAVCLALHGAGVVEGIEDMEGDLLQSVREVIGYSIPLVVTLDLHANLTDKMVYETDILIGTNFYPHIDKYERGREAIELAKRMVDKDIRPVSHFIKLPLIIPSSCTELYPTNEINEACWDWERKSKVIDCTFYHGFNYTNISHLGCAVLVTTNGDSSLSEKISKEIAKKIWSLKENFFVDLPSPNEGLQMAVEHNGKPVVINEISDNPGGGAPGDGTHLLKVLLEEKIEDSCFGYICDPEAAQLAHEAGVGSFIEVKLGGKIDKLHGESLLVRAFVKCLTDGKFIQSSPVGRGSQVNLGKSARLQVGAVDIIVCSVRAQTLDEQIFLLHGIDIRDYKVVALKSSIHFRASFEPISSKIISVDSPGLTTNNFMVFNYTKLKNKMYPIDKSNLNTVDNILINFNKKISRE